MKSDIDITPGMVTLKSVKKENTKLFSERKKSCMYLRQDVARTSNISKFFPFFFCLNKRVSRDKDKLWQYSRWIWYINEICILSHVYFCNKIFVWKFLYQNIRYLRIFLLSNFLPATRESFALNFHCSEKDSEVLEITNRKLFDKSTRSYIHIEMQMEIEELEVWLLKPYCGHLCENVQIWDSSTCHIQKSISAVCDIRR